MSAKSKLRPALVLLFVTVLFHWRTLLTKQFTLLAGSEGVNQVYSWYTFWIRTFRSGRWPLWDPFTFAGHPFAGEMQTAAFYPLNFVLALVPFNRNGLFSPALFHLVYSLAHVAAAYFTYLLARELDLDEFPAILCGLCFSLGGLLSRFADWAHMLQSGIWLPLIFLFLVRALKAQSLPAAAFRSMLCGLSLGLSILAGGLHLVILQGIVVISAAVFYNWNAGRTQRVRAALAVSIAVMTAFAAGSPQLLSSMEYSRISYRYLGNTMVPASEKIPYAYLSDKLLPNGILQLVSPVAFNGQDGFGEVISSYLGVLPFIMAGVAVWKCWGTIWVRYLAGLAVISYIYSLGNVSLLHGVLYAITPFLWIAREAPRALYLVDFALALLCGFGAQFLLTVRAEDLRLEKFVWLLNRIAAGCALALAVPMLFGKPELSSWMSFSIVMVLMSCAICRYIVAGHRTTGVRVLILAIVLFDLYGWDWSPRNKIEIPAGADNLDILVSTRDVSNFLRSRPGPFRVQFAGDPHPNIGDAYGIETTSGGGVTLLKDFEQFMGRADLLNVRYTLRPASAADPGAIYQDASWKVYENPHAFPRAWVVHQTEVQNSADKMNRRLAQPNFDAHLTGLLDTPPGATLDPAPPGAPEEVRVREDAPDRINLDVHTAGKAMIVLSEIYCPGWRAVVNGSSVPILRVDGALRGLIVPAGNSMVSLHYAPTATYIGAAITALTFGFALCVLILRRIRAGRGSPDPAENPYPGEPEKRYAA